MESIRVTPETMAQYKADCQADYARIRKEKRQLALEFASLEAL